MQQIVHRIYLKSADINAGLKDLCKCKVSYRFGRRSYLNIWRETWRDLLHSQISQKEGAVGNSPLQPPDLFVCWVKLCAPLFIADVKTSLSTAPVVRGMLAKGKECLTCCVLQVAAISNFCLQNRASVLPKLGQGCCWRKCNIKIP